jgi:hypothetical protein
VPAKVGRIQRDHDDMANPDRDLLLAAGAQVGLARLGWLDPADLSAFARRARCKAQEILHPGGKVQFVCAPKCVPICLFSRDRPATLGVDGTPAWMGWSGHADRLTAGLLVTGCRYALSSGTSL